MHALLLGAIAAGSPESCPTGKDSCRRYTPCLVRDPAATPITAETYCAHADTAHMQRAANPHRCLRAPLNAAGGAAKLEALGLSGATLRITGPEADGFWVRALLVLAQARWAQLAGLSVDVAYRSEADAYLVAGKRADGWTQYFEPLAGTARGQGRRRIVQLDCSAGALAWEQ